MWPKMEGKAMVLLLETIQQTRSHGLVRNSADQRTLA
jgi:hypothetical protein